MSASDGFDLDRFVSAQDRSFEAALEEMRSGRKRSHWMWFIFPQLRSLGHSQTAQFYGIASLAEAQAYLRHPVLGPRLVEVTDVVNGIEGRSAHQIFGSPDDMKFRSSVTLFSIADPAIPAFGAALKKYFAGVPDPRSVELLA